MTNKDTKVKTCWKFKDNDGVYKKLYEGYPFVKVIKVKGGVTGIMESGIKMFVPYSRIVGSHGYDPKKIQTARYRPGEEVWFHLEGKGIESMIITGIGAGKKGNPIYCSIYYDEDVRIDEVNLYKTKQDLLMDETP